MDGADHRPEHPEEVILLDYVIGHLDPADSDAIRRHVSFCEACRDRIIEISSAMDELDRLPTASIPHDVLLVPRERGFLARNAGRLVPFIALIIAVVGILLLFEVGGFGTPPQDAAADRRVLIRSAATDPTEVVAGLLAGIPHRIVTNRDDDRHLIVLVPDAQVRAAGARLAPSEGSDGRTYVVDIAGTGVTLAGEVAP